MYIETVKNRTSPPAILLRESFREDGRVKKRTLLNLTTFPTHIVDGFRSVLKGTAVSADQAVTQPQTDVMLSGGASYGGAAAVIGMIRKLGLERLIDGAPSRQRNIVVAMIADRLLHGDSKLSTARHCHAATASSAMGSLLDLEDLDEHECYAAMDWLFERKSKIEKKLARKHLAAEGSVLYDLSSSYFEGHTCPLAQYGYSRDHRGDLPQVNYGLYCNEDGLPFAVDILPGNEGDRVAFPKTVARVRDEFAGRDVVFVGDRGMIGGKIINETLRDLDGAHWVTCLNNATIARLARESAIQLTMFDERDLVSLTHPDFPDERLIACRNPLLAEERKRKRGELLDATDALLNDLAKRIAKPRSKIRGKDTIGIQVGKLLNRKKMGKHYVLTITDDSFTFERDDAKITAEAALDGIYVVRTSVNEERLDDAAVVSHYKKLAAVERAFRSMKSIDIGVRPIYHRNENRVRTHIFICMLAYYVELHMRRALAPILFHDENTAPRQSIVAPAQRTPAAKKKDADRSTTDGWPVASFRDTLITLDGIVRARIEFDGKPDLGFHTASRPNKYQRHIIELLGLTKRM